MAIDKKEVKSPGDSAPAEAPKKYRDRPADEGKHGDAADEPNVRQIQHHLHGTVCDQWQGKRQYRGEIDVRDSRGVDALRRQAARVCGAKYETALHRQ